METKISLIRDQVSFLYKEYVEEMHSRVGKGEISLCKHLDDLHSVQTDKEQSDNRAKRLKLIEYTNPLVSAVRNAINHLQCTEFSL